VDDAPKNSRPVFQEIQGPFAGRKGKRTCWTNIDRIASNTLILIINTVNGLIFSKTYLSIRLIKSLIINNINTNRHNIRSQKTSYAYTLTPKKNPNEKEKKNRISRLKAAVLLC